MAAIGDIVSKSNAKKAVYLMVGATGNVAAPTGTPTRTAAASAADGIPCFPTSQIAADDGHCYSAAAAAVSTLLIKGRVTAGQTLVGTFTLWGYDEALQAWFEIPVNGGTAITPVALAETTSDQINFQQQFNNLGHYDRLALELSSIGGTGATFDAMLVTSRTVSY